MGTSEARQLVKEAAESDATELRLAGNQLTEVPPELAQLTNLQTLHLGGNQLTEVPPELAQLTNLQYLTLGGNQLTEVPPELAQLTNLQTLTLNSNQLTEVPPELAQLTNLQTLSLNGNQLTEVPPELAQLTNLQTLTLNSNQLTEVPPELAQLTNLQTLTLHGNQLTEVPPELAQLTNLQRLTLNGNQLKWLPHQLSAITGLTTPNLRQTPSFSDGELGLGGNRFGPELLAAAEEGIQQLWDYLRNNEPPADEEVESGTTGGPAGSVQPGDLEVLSSLPPETEADLRMWLEPLVGVLTSAIDDGLFGDPLDQHRAEQDRDYLRAQIHETELGEMRVGLVTQLSLSIVGSLSPLLDEPGAQVAGEMASAAGNDNYGPNQAVAQRDALAEATGKDKSEIDKALFGFEIGLGVASAVATIYASIETAGAGVLLGAAVAIAHLLVRRKLKG